MKFTSRYTLKDLRELNHLTLKQGSYTKKFAAGEYQVPCALIIGTRKPSTDLKTSLNNALREYDVAV